VKINNFFIGAIVLIALLVGLFLCIRKHRRNQIRNAQNGQNQDELENDRILDEEFNPPRPLNVGISF